MTTQDDVAERLMRTPIIDMHRLMLEFSSTVNAPWFKVIAFSSTQEFLLSHGWPLDMYIAECKRLDVSKAGFLLGIMCGTFADHV